jgi:glycolate oxidase
MLDPAVHAQLASVLPPSALLTSAEETRPYECDGLTMYRELPAAVALPENEAQLVEVLKRCHAAGVPVVARGRERAFPAARFRTSAASSLRWRSSATSCRSTRDVHGRRSAGVRNLAISAVAAPYGLYYAPIPSSQIACTIGGNVGENAGGVHCLKYGLTVHNVRRVRGVLISGEIVEFGGEALDSPATTCWRWSMGPRVCWPSPPKLRSS